MWSGRLFTSWRESRKSVPEGRDLRFRHAHSLQPVLDGPVEAAKAVRMNSSCRTWQLDFIRNAWEKLESDLPWTFWVSVVFKFWQVRKQITIYLQPCFDTKQYTLHTLQSLHGRCSEAVSGSTSPLQLKCRKDKSPSVQ